MTALDVLRRLANRGGRFAKDDDLVTLVRFEALAIIAEIEERERKVERLIRASAAVADPGLELQEWNKGLYGSGSRLWREYEEAVAALQAEQGGE